MQDHGVNRANPPDIHNSFMRINRDMVVFNNGEDSIDHVAVKSIGEYKALCLGELETYQKINLGQMNKQ